MFFIWATWQMEAGRTRMGSATYDILGPYLLSQPEIIFVKPYVDNMLSLVGK